MLELPPDWGAARASKGRTAAMKAVASILNVGALWIDREERVSTSFIVDCTDFPTCN